MREIATVLRASASPELLTKIQVFARETQQDSAHDFSHLARVAKNALKIAETEGGDAEVLLAAAYLHDIANLPKNHPEAKRSSELSMMRAEGILKELKFPESKLPLVKDAILCHSFSLGQTPQTLEGKIFQDADRLDALGVVGIFRAIVINGRMGEGLYHPEDPFFNEVRELDDRKWGLDHFYKKLFLLPQLMNTRTGKLMAEKRVEAMQGVLAMLKEEIG